jgi:hypothetical protein
LTLERQRTVTVIFTGAAAWWLSSPAWLASMTIEAVGVEPVTVPTTVRVAVVLPFVTEVPVVCALVMLIAPDVLIERTENVTGNPELAAAISPTWIEKLLAE